MPQSYQLSESQRTVWIEQLPVQKRGLHTQIAKALERKNQGTEASFRTQLSAFFKGEKKGLKAIFDHSIRLQVVADHMNATQKDLHRWLNIARGAKLDDDLSLIRVPGFEDCGPVPIEDAYFPPKIRQVQFLVGGPSAVSTSGGGNLDIDKIVAVVHAPLSPPRPRAVIVVGQRGLGRTPTLQMLSARLSTEGLRVSWGAASCAENADVLVLDELEAIDPVKRAVALEHANQHASIILCSLEPGNAIPKGVPPERVLIDLAEGNKHWAVEYLTHLEEKVSPALRRPISTQPLRQWIANEPDSTGFLDRADTLGLVARHVSDEGTIPVRLSELLPIVLRRLTRSLRADGKGGEALVVELCLKDTMRIVALIACQSGAWSLPAESWARALVASGDGLMGRASDAWGQLGAPGMLTVLDALSDCGFLLRTAAGELQPNQRVLQAVALGNEIAARPNDHSILHAAVVDARWHDAVIVAAELLNDLSPILEAFETSRLGVQVHAYPVVTRLLASNVPCTNGELLNRWFKKCLLWWASTPPESRSISMTLWATVPASPTPQFEAIIGGTAPLLVLSRASRLRQAELHPISSADELIKSGTLCRAATRYLEAFGRTVISSSVADAMVVGAPYQTELIYNAALWSRFPSATMLGHDLPGGLSRDEYAIWWRTAASGRLLQHPDGTRMICGTSPGWSITSSMCQTDEVGSKQWVDLLIDALKNEVAGASEAYASAVAYVLSGGGTANFNAVQTVWEALHPRHRRPLWQPILTALPAPEKWFIRDDATPWVLHEVLRSKDLIQCWDSWTCTSDRILLNLPWKHFLTAGLATSTVLAWALETMPDEPRAKDQTVSRIESTGGGAAFQLHDPKDAPQAAVLDHLVQSTVPEILEGLLGAPEEWMQKAWQKLGSVAPERQREILLSWAIAAPNTETRFRLLKNVTPLPGEAEQWRAIATVAEHWIERLFRLVQVSVATTGNDRWDACSEVLDVLEALVGEPDTTEQRLMGILSSDEDSAPQVQQLAAQIVNDVADHIPQLLYDIGSVLGQAADADDSLHGITRRIFAGPLRPHVIAHASLWQLAWNAGGFDYVVDLLVVGNNDLPNGTATLNRLYQCTNAGLFDSLIGRLLLHPEVGRAATLVFANRIAAQHIDIMRDGLEGQPMIDADGNTDPATLALARRLASTDAKQLMEWALPALQFLPSRAAGDWWESLLPSLPPGPTRAIATTAWADARAAVEG